MCKQYHYESICSISSCDTVLGRRHRNKWCGEALRARRLGKCTAGVEIQKTITETTRARCSKCKEELLAPRRTRTEGKTGKNTGSSNTGAPKPPRQRKARSAPKKASKRALDEEEGETEKPEKKRLKVATCMVVASKANKEPLEVESPIDKVDNAYKRASGEEEEGPEEKPVEVEPPIEEARPTNKRSLSEEGEEGEEPEKKRPRVESPTDEAQEDRNVQDTTVDQASSGDEGCLPTPAPSPQHR
ncbi:hypothetical protein F4809DRAFT_656039 [Biscogniauxia mediterranea]|nr:hypothetical protein F4809DRAFT_656039 [Biscogniauxia mediterranea]